MRYDILGPLRITDGGRGAVISAGKMETLLAVLLVRANHVVARDHLSAEIWGEAPPRRAAAALHVYVSQLRKVLGRPGRGESPIVTTSPGYQLRLGGDELDVHSFEEHVHRGRSQARVGDREAAATSFEQALAVWRGPALSGVSGGPILSSFAAWTEEARLECVEMLMEVRLGLGHHRELVGPLQVLTIEHPLRESFYRHLMMALYRSDRQGEALRVYELARHRLNEELGLEPCQSLRDLHRAILLADGRLALERVG